MKSKLLFGIIVVALLSSMFVEVSSAESANSISDIKSSGAVYEFTLSWEGEYWTFPDPGWSSLGSLEDRDTFIMTLTTDLKITVIVADCCLMGDTIAVFYPTPYRIKTSATSPDIVKVTGTLPAGTYKFYVGYTLPHTGVFPAGYYMWVIASHA